MSQHPLRFNIDDAVADLIGDVSNFRDESTPGYWSAANAIRNLSAQLRMLLQKPYAVDDQGITYGRHTSRSLLNHRPFTGGESPVLSLCLSSTRGSYKYDESRAKHSSSLSSPPSVGRLADASEPWSPMLLDFGPGFGTSHDNGESSTSNTSVAPPLPLVAPLPTLHIETSIADGTVDPRDLNLDPWCENPTLNTPSQLEHVQPSTGLALLTDVRDPTKSAGGVGVEGWSGESSDAPEGNMYGHEADEMLEMFYMEEALKNPVEVPIEPANGSISEVDPVVSTDDSGPAKGRSVTKEIVTLTIRKPTTFIDHPKVGAQRVEDSANQNCPKVGRKGRRRGALRAVAESSISADIVQMPVNGDCFIEPETVYRLIESNCKNATPAKAHLRSLTRFFYGLASPLALREFQEVCQSARADLRFLARDLGLPETLQILKQAEELACEASNARRMSLARIRYGHRIKVREIREETGLVKDRTASTPAYERMIAEELPSLAKGEPEYVGMFDHLKSKSSQGRHWVEFGEKFCRGLSLLVLVPHSGPHAVHDSDIERVSDDEFEAFINALVKLRGTFLEKVAAKTDRILEAMQRSTPRQVADGQLTAQTPLSHELRELFGCLEPEITLP